MRFNETIGIEANLRMVMRERGKLVERREYHNVFTITGRNWLSKLSAWSTIGSQDIPFTQRRVRWMGAGIGSQLEVTTVAALAQPTLATSTDFLSAIQTVNFPTSTSVEFIKEFSVNEITVTGAPVALTEVALFVDYDPAEGGLANDGTEDVEIGGSVNTTLNPAIGTNSPVAYKTFDPITKTIDFTFEVQWEFRF